MTRRIIQWTLKFAIVAFLLLVITAAGSFLYVYLNREIIISRVSAAVNKMMNGEFRTGKIDVDFFHYFPRTAIHFHDVSLRDTLFTKHKMEFLHADDVFVKINFRDLFSSKLNLENLSLHKGSIYIFKDTTGYTNLLKPGMESRSDFRTLLHEIGFYDFRFIYHDRNRDRFINIFFNNFRCGFQEDQDKTTLVIKSDGKIKMLGLNLKKGSYARSASFTNNFIAYYDPAGQQLEIPPHTFYLNGELIENQLLLNFRDTTFSAQFIASRILFDNALKIATERTASLLSAYTFSRPLRISVQLNGSLQPGSLPGVRVEMSTAGNVFKFRDYEFTRTKLNMLYTNRFDPATASSVSNTAVIVSGFSGNWEGLPVNADTLLINRFPQPSVSSRLYGGFPLNMMNNISGGLYAFTNGECAYEIDFVAGRDSSGWETDYIVRLELKDGQLVYEPRGLPFKNVNASIRLNKEDVFIDRLECNVGESKLQLKGKANDIFSEVTDDKSDLLLSWEIKSGSINLDNFITFLGSRKNTLKVEKPSPKSKLGRQVDKYLGACRLRLALDVSSVKYDNFSADALSGIVQMINNKWMLERIRFRHAGGNVKLSGSMEPLGELLQHVSIKSDMKNVNISKVFTAFNNFSQQTIASDQIDGVLDADVTLAFNMNSKAVISQNSIDGKVKLSVKDGELKGFQPMGKLSKFLFRNRDFSNIRFSELSNSFIANGREIYFDRMKINSSIMELYVEGSYFLDGKTDMHIQVPLSNLKKRNWEELSDNITDKGQKGVNIFIHALTDEKGELRFRYDPLKKIKEKRVERD